MESWKYWVLIGCYCFIWVVVFFMVAMYVHPTPEQIMGWVFGCVLSLIAFLIIVGILVNSTIDHICKEIYDHSIGLHKQIITLAEGEDKIIEMLKRKRL